MHMMSILSDYIFKTLNFSIKFDKTKTKMMDYLSDEKKALHIHTPRFISFDDILFILTVLNVIFNPERDQTILPC